VVVDLGMVHGGLAASPGALYKFKVGGAARLPFLCADCDFGCGVRPAST
jgi:hypothetical protein